MRILWVKTDFLHPTTRGGQIRTLETLKQLHRRHEIHYVAFRDPAYPQAVPLSAEYCSFAHPVDHAIAPKRSLAFGGQLLAGLFSALPVAIGRYESPQMREQIRSLLDAQHFDSVVCDFLAPAPNLPDITRCVLFQHNVETTIWERHVQHAGDPLRRAYFHLQARRMADYERQICLAARQVIAVSDTDAALMRDRFGVTRIAAVPTGVDIEYFQPPPSAPPLSDLVFVGSMDWLPNIDAIKFFTSAILPLIRQRRPETSLAVVGRSPTPEILALATQDPLLRVTGTVPDVRPFLWGAKASIVPIRIGGGTRLKIYESMAAGVPVVSTPVGAEGLEIHPPDDIAIAAEPAEFAARCLELLQEPARAARMAAAARRLVATRFSWEQISLRFEDILLSASLPPAAPSGLR